MLLIRRDQKTEFLKKVPMFSNLNNRQLIEIAKHAEQLFVKHGEVLVEQGRRGSEFYFIVEGKAQVKKDLKVIRKLANGDFFGEISLIDREPRTATVIADTDMTLLVVDTKSFAHLLDVVPGLQGKIIIALCRYIRLAEKPSIVS
ncbi:MAG: cyclic nucleotide-binding domain-containing protein [Deltaproteobacteria bacterium]|nr:cyclic nucleotide-binding domain-containing protein [Deltaproteobacteria bacterium]